MWYHMAFVCPSFEKIYSQDQSTQPSESLTSVIAFDFDIEGQQCQATHKKGQHKLKNKKITYI